MLTKDILTTILKNNKGLMPAYHLEDTVDELGESHLEALIELDNLNKKIRELENTIILIGRSHIEYNRDSKK